MKQHKFFVLTWDFNTDRLTHYDVLPFFRNKLKERNEKYANSEDYNIKPPKTYEELLQFIEMESLCQFWSRCEYEMIIHGWPVQKNDYKIDVHEQILMNIDTIANILYNEDFQQEHNGN